MKNNSDKNDLKLNILKLAYKKGFLIKKEAADSFNINIMTISSAVNELVNNDKLLVEAGEGKSGGGRRPTVYKINSSLGYVIGVDIGGDNTRLLITDLSGNIINKRKEKITVTNKGKLLLDNILSVVYKLIEDSKISKSSICGIGIGVSGVIDSVSGISIYCPNINGLNSFPIKKYINSKTGFYVFVDDSVRCMAVAEKHYGFAKDYDNFLFISLGRGIGAAIYVNGAIYRGSMGLTGELGHITVSEDGPLCNCGNRGCLEAIASETGIIRRAKEGIDNGVITEITSRIDNDINNLSIEIISEAAKEGDKFAFDLINRTGEYIGIAIAAALNLFGVELIVLGGGISFSGEILIEAIKRTVQIRALNVISKKVKILRTELDEFIAARGAATKILNTLFSDSDFNILQKS